MTDAEWARELPWQQREPSQLAFRIAHKRSSFALVQSYSGGIGTIHGKRP